MMLEKNLMQSGWQYDFACGICVSLREVVYWRVDVFI